ncbi:hypothetical protein MRX96_020064 [Rhipicephalus microplus]
MHSTFRHIALRDIRTLHTSLKERTVRLANQSLRHVTSEGPRPHLWILPDAGRQVLLRYCAPRNYPSGRGAKVRTMLLPGKVRTCNGVCVHISESAEVYLSDSIYLLLEHRNKNALAVLSVLTLFVVVAAFF